MTDIGCGVLILGPEIGTQAKPGELREFCGAVPGGQLCVCCEARKDAARDTARLNTMDRLGWTVSDGGDHVSLPGLVSLREAVDEYCARYEIEVE